MVDVVITATSVVNVNGTKKHGIAGAVITAGQVVYRDTTASNVLKLADADTVGGLPAVVYGIALNGAAIGQAVAVQVDGDVTIGGTLVTGDVYVLSGTPGAIAPIADLANGDYTVVLGVAISTTRLRLIIKSSGVVKA